MARARIFLGEFTGCTLRTDRALTPRSPLDYVAPMRLFSVHHHHAHESHVLRVGAVRV